MAAPAVVHLTFGDLTDNCGDLNGLFRGQSMGERQQVAQQHNPPPDPPPLRGMPQAAQPLQCWLVHTFTHQGTAQPADYLRL